MLRFLKRIGRRLGLVRLASGGEVPETVHGDVLRRLVAEQVRRASIANRRYGGFPRAGLILKPSLQFQFYPAEIASAADLRLQLAAEQFAAAVIDALQNG